MIDTPLWYFFGTRAGSQFLELNKPTMKALRRPVLHDGRQDRKTRMKPYRTPLPPLRDYSEDVLDRALSWERAAERGMRMALDHESRGHPHLAARHLVLAEHAEHEAAVLLNDAAKWARIEKATPSLSIAQRQEAWTLGQRLASFPFPVVVKGGAR